MGFFEDCTNNEVIKLSVNYQNQIYNTESICIGQSWYTDDDFPMTALQDNDEILFSVTTADDEEIFSG